MQSRYTTWLRWILIIGLGASIFIPFIVANGSLFPNMFFPFITGKNFTFRILVELLFGVYVLLALREPRYRPRFSWVLLAVLCFTFWVGIADIFSVDPVKSFWSNFERMEGYITVLHLLAYFIMVAAVFSAEKMSTWFFRISLAASVLMSFYGVLQLMGKIAIDQGGVRLDGTLGNAIYLAVYMLFNIFFGLILLYRDWKNITLRILYGIVILLDTFILIETETRGTILGLMGGLVIAGLYLLWETRHDTSFKVLRRISLSTLGFIALLVIAFFAVKNMSWVQNVPALDRLASISLQDRTTQARFTIWQMAWEGFKEKPIFGWGQENFNFVFNKFYIPAMYDQEQWFDRAHDAYLDWLSNAGLFGFLLFISLFVSAAWALYRSKHLSIPERAALLGLLGGFAFHEIFVFDNLISYMQFFALLALAHALSQREVPGKVWMSRPLSEHGMAIAAPVVVVVALGGAWFLNAPGITNAEVLVEAIQTPPTQNGAAPDFSQNLNQFKAVLANGLLGKQEETEQLLQFTMNLAQSQSVSPELKQDFYNESYSAITEMTKERPGDARLELFFGSFLDLFGQYQDGLKHLQMALVDSPQKQQIMFEIGTNNYAPSGDTADALAILGKAYNLDTVDDQALIYYVGALYESGDAAQADALLTKRYGTVTPDDDSLLQIYYNTKQYTRAVTIISNRLSSDPTNGQTWLQLAAVFYAAGDNKDAITALQKGAQEDPSFASEANQLIQQLQTSQ